MFNRYSIAYREGVSLISILKKENKDIEWGHFRHILANITQVLLFISKGELSAEDIGIEITRKSLKAVATYRKLLKNKEFRRAELNVGYFNTEGRMPIDENGKPIEICDSIKYIMYARKHFYSTKIAD